MAEQQEVNVAGGEPASSNPVNNKPNKWVAAILGLLSQPIGMLYVAQPWWAAIYFFGSILLVIQANLTLRQYPVVAVIVMLVPAIVCPVHAYRLAGKYPADKPRPRYSRWYGLVGAFAGIFLVVGVFRMFLFESFTISSGSMLPTLAPRALVVVQKWEYGHYSAYGMRLFEGGKTTDLLRGDVVVFDYPGDPSVQYVMRVVGVPGDKLVYRDKMLSINGAAAVRRNDGTYQFAARPGMPLKVLARSEETLGGTSYSILNDNDRPPILKDAVAAGASNKCRYDDRGVACEIPEGQYFVLGDNRDDARDSRYWGFVPADHIVGKVAYVLQ